MDNEHCFAIGAGADIANLAITAYLTTAIDGPINLLSKVLDSIRLRRRGHLESRRREPIETRGFSISAFALCSGDARTFAPCDKQIARTHFWIDVQMIFPIFLSYLIGISSGAEAYRRPETIKPPLTGDAVQNLGEHLHRKVVEQDSPHSTGDLLNNGTGLHRVTHFYPSQLFADVQLKRLFPDSKTFCDMIPVRRTIDEIIKEYSSLDHSSPSFSLTKFVLDNFEVSSIVSMLCP